MKSTNDIEGLLVLADGQVFTGKLASPDIVTTGEICFNTGMTGYQEVFTDPSYYGQILVATHVHIGNYGILESESESNGIKIAGLVCRSFEDFFSRSASQTGVREYFKKHNILAISNVDTRAVVRYIRSKGAMNAIIGPASATKETLLAQLEKVPSMAGLELSSKVSTDISYTFGDEKSKIKTAVLDLGIKTNSLRCLSERGCYVKVFPHNTSFAEMEAWQPNGYLISNGPGDPSVMPEVVKTVKQIVDSNKPLFGICLGHQILAESQGIGTFKMFNGHRGINHPVKNIITGTCEITSQNHGFAVVKEDVEKHTNIEVTHVNLNDGSIEGIRVKKSKASSVQYHPESAPGPHDSRYLFDDFVALMK